MRMGHPRLRKSKKTKVVKEVLALKEREKEAIATKEIPHMEPYVKEVFYGFNLNGLLIDAILIIFSFIISGEFFSEGGLFDRLKTWQILGMYCAVVMMLPYYLGYVYQRNTAYFSKRVMKLQLWIFIIMTFMVLVNLVRLVLSMEDIENLKNDENSFFAAFSMFMLVLRPNPKILQETIQ